MSHFLCFLNKDMMKSLLYSLLISLTDTDESNRSTVQSSSTVLAEKSSKSKDGASESGMFCISGYSFNFFSL